MPRLFDLVRAKEELVRTAFYFALRDCLVAKDIEQGTRVAYGKTRYRVVTLKGEVVEISGAMSGGGNTVIKGKMGLYLQLYFFRFLAYIEPYSFPTPQTLFALIFIQQLTPTPKMDGNHVYSYDQPTKTDPNQQQQQQPPHPSVYGSYQNQPGTYQPPTSHNNQPPTYQATQSSNHSSVVVSQQPSHVTTQVFSQTSGPSDSGMGLAIFACICCCWPLGIFAIMRASQVSGGVGR